MTENINKCALLALKMAKVHAKVLSARMFICVVWNSFVMTQSIVRVNVTVSELILICRDNSISLEVGTS